MRFTRRQILAGLAGTLTIPAVDFVKAAETSAKADEESHAVIGAAVERLLPGAVAAGLPAYIDYWLSQKPFQAIRRHLAQGALALDQTARKQYRHPFIACAAKEQDAILTMLAKGEARFGRLDGRRFFEQLMTLTLEGFLSDPKYGGNRDRVGWRFIGIPEGLGSCWWNPGGVRLITNPDDGFCD